MPASRLRSDSDRPARVGDCDPARAFFEGLADKGWTRIGARRPVVAPGNDRCRQARSTTRPVLICSRTKQSPQFCQQKSKLCIAKSSGCRYALQNKVLISPPFPISTGEELNVIVSAFRALDRILRGDATRLDELKTGQLQVSIRQIGPILLLLSAVYGVAMGLFATIHDGHPQLVVNVFKVPCLFLLTLLVTFPSLYVFNTLVGSRLSAGTLLKMAIIALGVMIAVLAALAPIVVFFSLSTSSHPFMVLLNGANFLIAASWGRTFLMQTMHGLLLSEDSTSTQAHSRPNAPDPSPTDASPSGNDIPTEVLFEGEPTPEPATIDGPRSADHIEAGSTQPDITQPATGHTGTGHTWPAVTNPSRPNPSRPTPPATTSATEANLSTRTRAQQLATTKPRNDLGEESPATKVRGVLRTWLWIFALVGLQMSWILGPFVGNPGGDFLWFHPPGQGNFFMGFLKTILQLYS